MTHILRRETEFADLRDGGFFRAQLNVVGLQKEFGKPPMRVRYIARAEAGIDQNKACIALDKQAVAHKMPEQIVAPAGAGSVAELR